MDTGEGKFVIKETGQTRKELEKEYPHHGGWFKVGETIIIRGSNFRVKSVNPTEIRLKLLPRKKKIGG